MRQAVKNDLILLYPAFFQRCCFFQDSCRILREFLISSPEDPPAARQLPQTVNPHANPEEEDMKIFVIVGMPAAGKNIARIYAESKGFPYFATGDLVRAEVRRRGFDADAASTAAVSTELRGDDGLGVTRMALETALKANSAVVFLEGMRSWPEIALIRQKADCIVVAFLAPKSLRLMRITARGRADDFAGAFDERDQREIAYGTAVPIALADEYILNTGAMDDAIRELDKIVFKAEDR
jgi:dephospho-CoA kinase